MKPRFADRIIITQPYVPARETNIRKTFQKERERLANPKPTAKAIPLKRRTA